MEYIFTANIKAILQTHFGKRADDIFEKSQIIQYINEKTRSANKGSKARSSFANLYAIDFKKKILGFHLSVTLENKGISFSGNQNIYLKSCSRN